MTGRKQYTQIGSYTSTVKAVGYGVPQGSVLGPLLFVLYVNDIMRAIKTCKFLMYADDLVFYTSNNKVPLEAQRLQSDIDNVALWCKDKRLTVNTDKTKTVWFGSGKKLPRLILPDFVMDGRKLECVKEYTYLGLRLDCHLTMELAMKDLSQKVNNRLFRFTKLRHLLTNNASILVYKTMIMTVFDYCSFAYAGCTDTTLLKMQRLQNRGLRTCYRYNREHLSIIEMHNESGVPYLKRRREELLLTLMYKHSRKPDYVDLRRGERVTRSENKIKFLVKQPKLAGYKKSPLYRGAHLWNLLGDWYHHTECKQLFKTRIQRLDNIEIVNENPDDSDSFVDDESIMYSDSDSGSEGV